LQPTSVKSQPPGVGLHPSETYGGMQEEPGRVRHGRDRT
jgi:hypothetical protein